MESLGIYGKIIRKYEGTGLITLFDGKTCNCSILAVQIADGKIIASCVITENFNLIFTCFGKKNVIKSIKGTTSENDDFLLEGDIICTSLNHSWKPDEKKLYMVVIAGSLKYSKHQNDTPALVKFGITNFNFSGNTITEYPSGGLAWDVLSLILVDKNVEIHEVQDHKAIMDSVRTQKGIDVTSEVIADIPSFGDIDKVIPYINILCKLLSVARGTKINWIYYDCYSYLGKKMSSCHEDRIVWQYAGLPLINGTNPHDTASFIKQAFPVYLMRKDDYGLEKAIESYLDAKRESGYLETRALRAIIVFEYLKSKYSSSKGNEFILRCGQFRKIRKKTRLMLEEQLKEMSLFENAFKEMESKIGELNRLSFRAILETMFAEYKINISKDELNKLVKIRNSLVHKASFFTKEYWKEYSFLIGILDRIFLKILNYNGIYLDITDNFKHVDISQIQT